MAKREMKITAAEQQEKQSGLDEDAMDVALSPCPAVGLWREDRLAAAKTAAFHTIRQPLVFGKHVASLGAKVMDVVAGRSRYEAGRKDKRFKDQAWQDSAFHRNTLQAYLAWRETLGEWVDDIGLKEFDEHRMRFLLDVMADSIAPTNALLTNPTALRKVQETRGESLKQGVKHLLHDMRRNGGMPSQVDKSQFEVGRNLATTPGAVVYRNEILELIQYKPGKTRVYDRPLLVVPPQINKYYVYDLSPDESFFGFCLAQGLQLFIVSWRNPTPEHAIDLSAVDSDKYIVAGITDHITPWTACYRSTQFLGGDIRFVLSSSGHIQSLINPPGNPRAKYYSNAELPHKADDWLQGAHEVSGSWWEDWADWIQQRSGKKTTARKTLGNRLYPTGEAAPGSYVFG